MSEEVRPGTQDSKDPQGGASAGWGPMRLVADEPSAATVSSVYVHAPFCPRRCRYCDFSVTVAPRPDLEGWLAALAAELDLVAAEGRFPLSTALATVFVGGGTPSLLGPEAMAELAGILGPERFRDAGFEWTAEANPESFTAELARGWRAAGVNRVSLGAQSFHPDALRWMGRLHGPSEIGLAVERARAEGLMNINLDLIFGLPRTVERDWESDLDHALALEVPHLSLYGLASEEGTPLAKAVRAGRITLASDEAYGEEFLQASRRLQAGGYRHYEVSNFALPGFEARHNRAYWTLEPYLGLGNSAHSFLHPFRRWNLKAWGAYQKKVLAGQPPWEAEEKLGTREVALERIWLGLRTAAGILLDDLSSSARELVEEWALEGYARLEKDAVLLTPRGWLLLDHLAVVLDSVLEQDRRGGALGRPLRVGGASAAEFTG